MNLLSSEFVDFIKQAGDVARPMFSVCLWAEDIHNKHKSSR